VKTPKNKIYAGHNSFEAGRVAKRGCGMPLTSAIIISTRIILIIIKSDSGALMVASTITNDSGSTFPWQQAANCNCKQLFVLDILLMPSRFAQSSLDFMIASDFVLTLFYIFFFVFRCDAVKKLIRGRIWQAIRFVQTPPKTKPEPKNPTDI